MKKILLLIVFVLTSCYVDDIDYFPIESNLTEFEAVLLDSINNYRASINLLELKSDTLAQSVARKHCQYMIDNDKISHDNFSKRVIFLQDYGADKVGETVGYGFGTPSGFLYGYLNSPSHKAVLERDYYTHIGVIVLKNKIGRNYNVLIFVNYKD